MNRTDRSKQLWEDRTKRLGIVLDSYRRRGESCAWSKDIARILGCPESSVRRIGRTMLDRVNMGGVDLTYNAGLFGWVRRDIRLVD